MEIPARLLVVYCLVHLRFVGMMTTSPFFFATAAPLPFRFLCASMLTVASFGAVESLSVPEVLFENAISLFLLATRELLLGALMGLLAALPLTAMQISGEQIGISMGLSMANTLDPLSQTQTALVSQLQYLVGLWFYFRWNGHLLTLQAVVESLRLIPPGSLSFFPVGDMGLGIWLLEVFRLAMRIVIPFYCALLLADVGLGFLARTVPQMNIFVLGLPLKIALGFFVMIAVLPLAVELIYNQMERWVEFALESASAFR